MSENENVKEHQGTKRSLNYLAVGVVGISAKSCPMVGGLGCQRLLWDAGEERRDVDSLTGRTGLLLEVEGLVLEQVDGHLGRRLGMVHVVSALVHVLVDTTIACIVQLCKKYD